MELILAAIAYYSKNSVFQKFPISFDHITHFDLSTFRVKRDEVRLVVVKLRERPHIAVSSNPREEQRKG